MRLYSSTYCWKFVFCISTTAKLSGRVPSAAAIRCIRESFLCHVILTYDITRSLLFMAWHKSYEGMKVRDCVRIGITIVKWHKFRALSASTGFYKYFKRNFRSRRQSFTGKHYNTSVFTMNGVWLKQNYVKIRKLKFNSNLSCKKHTYVLYG